MTKMAASVMPVGKRIWWKYHDQWVRGTLHHRDMRNNVPWLTGESDDRSMLCTAHFTEFRLTEPRK